MSLHLRWTSCPRHQPQVFSSFGSIGWPTFVARDSAVALSIVDVPLETEFGVAAEASGEAQSAAEASGEAQEAGYEGAGGEGAGAEVACGVEGADADGARGVEGVCAEVACGVEGAGAERAVASAGSDCGVGGALGYCAVPATL